MKITSIGGQIPGLFSDMLNQSHLLIAGASGSGKSVLLNGLVCSILRYHPNQKKMILIDPKMTELNEYACMPHTLRHATANGEIIAALDYAMGLVNSRYKGMQRRRLRMYDGPDVYVIIEEFADLMLTLKKQALPTVQRLCQIGRAAKVHVILVTQCPLATVIPTVIKVNLTAICGLHTTTRQQSRNILDMPGLEQLPKHGQCIYQTPAGIYRYDVPYTDDAEILKTTQFYLNQRSFLQRIFAK
nr:MAG TPA: DNA TRANSLOCASE FTSK [Caudoviricetes sp.]